MKKPTPQEVQAARETLVASGVIDHFWHKTDISFRATDRGIKLTTKQVDDIAQLIVKRHDAEQGINWDFIDIITNMYLEEN